MRRARPPVAFDSMRTARNIAIIAVLALIVDLAPGGGNAASAILTTISIVFLGLIGAGGYQLWRQYRLTYFGLTERQRALFVGSLGAIVLMIAGADEMTSSGGGVVVWIGVLAFSIFSIIKVWGDAQARY
jgi:hypothetical protein